MSLTRRDYRAGGRSLALRRHVVASSSRPPVLTRRRFLAASAAVGAAAVLPGATDVVLTTEDGLELGAWYLPAPDNGAPAVLVASGNAGSRASRAPLARSLAGGGLSVLLFDYRGYGGNPGSPSEQGLALDVRAARDFLLDVAGVPDYHLRQMAAYHAALEVIFPGARIEVALLYTAGPRLIDLPGALLDPVKRRFSGPEQSLPAGG